LTACVARAAGSCANGNLTSGVHSEPVQHLRFIESDPTDNGRPLLSSLGLASQPGVPVIERDRFLEAVTAVDAAPAY
jgi:hypothetical protein